MAKRYAERLPTQHEHAREIRQAYGYRDLSASDAAAGLRKFPDSQIVPKGRRRARRAVRRARGDVAVVAVAEIESDVVADVDPVLL